MTTMWQLRIRHADDTVELIELDPNRSMKFGSGAKADVRLLGDGLRDPHFAIVPREGAFYVVAAKSVRFLKCNDRLVSQQKLSMGDRLVLGEVVIEVVDSDSASAQLQAGTSASELEPLDSLEPLETLEPLEPLDTLEPAHALDDLPSLEEETPDLEDSQTFVDPLAEISELGEPSVDELEPTGGFGEEVSPLTHRPPVEVTKTRRRLPLTVRRFLIAGAAGLWFLLTAVVIVWWPSELPAPTSQAKLLANRDWTSLAAQSAQFVKDYPLSPYRAEVEAWQRLARWQQEFDSGGVSRSLLQEIESSLADPNVAFWEPDVQQPLAELLEAAIASQLETAWAQVRRRRPTQARETVEQAGKLLEIATFGLSHRYRQELRVRERVIEIARIRQENERREALASAEDAISNAAKSAGLPAVFRRYDELVARFPALHHQARFDRLLAEIVRRQAVGLVADEGQQSLEPMADPTMRLLGRQVSADTPLRVLPIEAGGSTLLATPQGKLVGVHVAGALQSELGGCPLSAGGAVILNTAPPGIVAYDGAGKLRWSARLSASPIDCIQYERGLIVLSADGRLQELDPDTGASVRRFDLQMPPASPGVLDGAKGVYWVASSRGVLWGVDLREGRNSMAIYTGHAPGNVACSPCRIGNWIVMAERLGGGNTRLRSWSVDRGRLAAEVTISGLLLQMVTTGGTHGFAVTAAGDLLRIGVSSDGQSFVITSSRRLASNRERLYRARRSDELWLCGARRLRLLRWARSLREPSVSLEVVLAGRLAGRPVSVGMRTWCVTTDANGATTWQIDSTGDYRRLDQCPVEAWTDPRQEETP